MSEMSTAPATVAVRAASTLLTSCLVSSANARKLRSASACSLTLAGAAWSSPTTPAAGAGSRNDGSRATTCWSSSTTCWYAESWVATSKCSTSASGRAAASLDLLPAFSTRSMATADRNCLAPSVSTRRVNRLMRRWRGTCAAASVKARRSSRSSARRPSRPLAVFCIALTSAGTMLSSVWSTTRSE